jgi:hypothetical protein
VVAFTGTAFRTGYEIILGPWQQADRHWYWDCTWELSLLRIETLGVRIRI